MAGTIVVDRIESDASYASNINVASQVTFSNTVNMTVASTFPAGTVGAPSITTTGDTNTGLFFPAADTIAFAEGGAEAVRINSSGFVGIGTTTPQRKLSIVGTDGATGQTEGNSRASLFLDNNGANYFSIFTGTSGDGAVFFSDNGSNNGGMVYETSSDALYFRANNAERARIDSSGNLLVGTTTYRGRITSEDTGTNTSSAPMGANVTSSAGSGSCWVFSSVRLGTNVGGIQNTSTATQFITSSDYRLKEAIAPMTGALATVSALKPVTYKWKADGSDGQGFIAHELQAVVPDCVTGEKDAVQEEQYEVTPAVKDADGNTITEAVMGTRMAPQYQGIDTSFLVATLTAAIQELKVIVDAQAVEIAALKAK